MKNRGHSKRTKIYTPEPIAIDLIKKIPWVLDDTWCDPCSGKGVFYNNFPVADGLKDWYEIDEGRDFFDCNKKYDWCVTNIPFDRPNEFIFKMAECSRKGFGVISLGGSMTATRLLKLKAMGFNLIDLTRLYIRSWGFGFITDFYVFSRIHEVKNLDVKKWED